MISKLFTLRALSPVHCGIGQIVNDIDLPTARNSVTGHPVIPGSSIKGVLKDEFQAMEGSDGWPTTTTLDTLFGKDENPDHASSVSMGDANLLALPVRSFFGTFAYLASPITLKTFKNNLERAGITVNLTVPTMGLQDDNGCDKASITTHSVLSRGNHPSVLLEEMDLLIDADNNSAQAWAEFIAPLFFSDDEGQGIFKKRFAVVYDDVLNFFCRTSLPVDARIAINQETGTVNEGALWYEESIPAESLFSGIIGIDRSFNSLVPMNAIDLAGKLVSKFPMNLQVGGKATTGKGFVALDIRKVTENGGES